MQITSRNICLCGHNDIKKIKVKPQNQRQVDILFILFLLNKLD